MPSTSVRKEPIEKPNCLADPTFSLDSSTTPQLDMRTFALFGLAAAAYAAPAMTKDEGYQYYKVQVNSVVTGSAPLISELRLLGGESNQKLTPVDVQCATGNNE